MAENKEGAFSSEDKKKILQEKEKHWVTIQIKGLSAWVNSYLQTANLSKIENLEKDLQNGVRLNQFLQVVSGKKLTFDLTPQMKIHKIQNLSTAIDFIQNTLNVKLVGISAEDIERGDIKLILGLIYSLFRALRISKIATEIGDDKKKSEAQQLIAWMNTILEQEPYELKLESFKDEPFKNGQAFGGLLHSYNNELIDYESLGTNGEENLKKIFEIFEQKLGIPQLLDVAEVVNGTVDERAMILYTSLIYHAHASQEERKKLEEGHQKKETELQNERMSKKQLEESYKQLLSEKERLEAEKQRVEKEKAEEAEERRKMEEERKRLEELIAKMEEERKRLEEERLHQNRKAEEERKRLQEEVERGISEQMSLRDKLLFLYQALLDERYKDIEEYLNSLKHGLSGSESQGKSNEDSGKGESGSGSGEGEEGKKATRNRVVRNAPKEDASVGIGDDKLGHQQDENKRTISKLKQELEELEDRIKQEIVRRKKDAQRLQQYEEKIKQYEMKAIEQAEANRALDILKKNLTEHVEDLKAWVDLSEFDLKSENKEAYDPTFFRGNLKDKTFEEQIDYLAEQLQSENQTMRRILQVKDSKKQLYDNYADKQGWLMMKTEENAEWKNQWFVLKGSELSYFPTEEKKDRAGGFVIDQTCSIATLKSVPFLSKAQKQESVFTLVVKLGAGNQLFIGATTKKGRNDWVTALKGKVVQSSYLAQVEEAKTRPDGRLVNLFFATADLGSIRLDNSPISTFTVSAVGQSLSNFDDVNVLTFASSEFGDEHAAVLAPHLKKAFIRHLDFSENHLTAGGAKQIADALLENKTIESLDFGKNQIGDDAADSIASLIFQKKISTLNLEDNKLTGAGVGKIVKSVDSHGNWTILQLSGNQLEDEGARIVAELVGKNNNVAEVQIARNKIGDEGVKALCEALKKNTSVTHLDLSGNLLSQVSLGVVNELLKENKTLKVVNLSENPQIIGGKGLEGAFSNEAFSLSGLALTRTMF